jgi:hypothetical protein
MKRRCVVLTIEAETVLTVRELRALLSVQFGGGPERCISRFPEHEKAQASVGTITQVQVNVVAPAPK